MKATIGGATFDATSRMTSAAHGKPRWLRRPIGQVQPDVGGAEEAPHQNRTMSTASETHRPIDADNSADPPLGSLTSKRVAIRSCRSTTTHLTSGGTRSTAALPHRRTPAPPPAAARHRVLPAVHLLPAAFAPRCPHRPC